MSTRKNFSFRYEWSEKIAHLSEKIQYQILSGTVAYARTGEFPAEASAEAREAFEEYILPDFIKRAKAAQYRARAKARKAVAAAPKSTAAPAQSATAQECDITAPAESADRPKEDSAPTLFRLSRAERRRRDRELKKKRRVSRYA